MRARSMAFVVMTMMAKRNVAPPFAALLGAPARAQRARRQDVVRCLHRCAASVHGMAAQVIARTKTRNDLGGQMPPVDGRDGRARTPIRPSGRVHGGRD